MPKLYLSLRGTLTTVIAVLAMVATIGPARAQHGQTTPVLDDYFSMVFAGDVSGAPSLFVDNPDDHGSRMLTERFERRFVERSDGLDLSGIEDAVVREIAGLFQSYWRDALMQTASLDELEERLKRRLDHILVTQGYAGSLDEDDKVLENVEALIRQKGYFAQSGRTPPLLDLMIWADNEVVTESVELTDGTYTVDLNYLDRVISYGWSSFATFGMASTGGWAKEDGLYCLCRNYDLESERFKLSFLKHEARHYADFKRYPELQPSDLEYRGKLTELAFSDEGTYRLVEHFHTAANRVGNSPHSLANWYVIEGLSALLLDGDRPADASAWKAIPKEQIRQAARSLLEEHDTVLADAGTTSTKGVINL